MGVLFYAAIFLAIGASVSQLKEAQIDVVAGLDADDEPHVHLDFYCSRNRWAQWATYFSLFPPVTPTCMMLRLATGQAIPLWQPILGLLLTTISTLLIVVIASRIFRVGILWQGKTPKLSEILKWAVTG